MVHYRRNRVCGGTFFFTVTLRERRSRLLVEHIDLLRDAFRIARQARPFETVATVVLPNHMHTIWTLPVGDHDYPGRWRAIKAYFTRALRQRGIALERDSRGEYRLWQRRYWEHTIHDENDLQRRMDYIHFNPVKHGLVTRVADWSYSSLHRYVRRNWLSADWGLAPIVNANARFGE